MVGINDLKRKLEAATELLSRTTDPIERSFLGGDVRELEKLFEISLGPDPDLLRHRRL